MGAESVGRAVLDITTDSSTFRSDLEQNEQRLQGMSANLRLVRTDLDRLAQGMTSAGKVSGDSLTMIGGMSQSGAANLKNLASQTQGVTGSMGGMLSTVGKVAGVFGVAFGVGAVVNFGKALLDDADALMKLKDKTDLSIGALKEMKRVQDASSVSTETQAKAVTALHLNIAGGGQSMVASLTKLGLKYEDIRRMSPEDMYFAVTKAAAGVTDETEQLVVATDLFGKKLGVEVLPAIKEGYGEVQHGMEKTVVALDEMGDALAAAWTKAKDLGSEVLAGAWLHAKDQIERYAASLHALSLGMVGSSGEAEALKQAQAALAAQLPKVAAAAQVVTINETEQANIERVLGERTKDLSEQTKKHADAVAKATKAHKDFQDSVNHSSIQVRQLGQLIVGGTNPALDHLADRMTTLQASVGDLSHKFAQDLSPQMLEAGGNMTRVAEEAKSMADTIQGHVRESLGRIPEIFINAFTGGGGVFGALKGIGVSLLNAVVQEILSPIWDAVAGWAGRIAGQIAGAFGGAGSGAAGLAASFTPGLIGGGGGAGAAAGAAGAVGLGTAALVTGGIAGAVALGTFIAGTWNQPTPSNTMGGDGMTIAEAIRASNRRTPAEQMAEFARNNPELYAAQVAAGEITPMADGGAGRATRPALFYTRGNEDFAFSGEGKRFGGDSSELLDVMTAMRGEWQGFRRDLLTILPTMVENAARHGAQTARARR